MVERAAARTGLVGIDNVTMLGLLATLISALVTSEASKNVLLIFVDDGGSLLSAYNNTVCDTPNLDKLAASSVTFTRAYTSVSSCSPSRSVLLTGLPQHQNGQYGLQHAYHHFQSFDDVQSLPQLLSKNGVRTGLIGKKHVAPPTVYKFDFERSTGFDLDQVGRNITYMKEFVREFLLETADRPFFLYIAFYDTHRGDNTSTFGQFMNKWGTGQPGMGLIPDWKPKVYDPDKVVVPYFLPDTPATRSDIAEMYTSFNRLDQGVGLFLEELKLSGHLDDTLIMFTADNGIPFPNAKTNLYEPGMGEPMLMSSPLHKEHWGKYSQALVSTMDFVPTVLDWFNITYPSYDLNGVKVELTGKSLLPLAADPDNPEYTRVYSSHDFHEITMHYPMRVVRDDRYRLIHNLNNRAPYPIATDLYMCPTFLDILNRTIHGQMTNWFKSLKEYYHRAEWELFNLDEDTQELHNLYGVPEYDKVFQQMQSSLDRWLWRTNDPWRCMPHGVLVNEKCWPLYNDL
ncbi:unnamed protein product [Lymnaea stagnalis]|uniref:Sulfatase N-terminal domain-containing protein n=1 Tax=Lymnaea stagnalis TaxID=6523 RepID=A0AAV2HW95_LYMST